jgi:hypothetical protein
MASVNFIAVLVAALANFIIGFLFHGPLFGKVWMKLANITPTGNEKFSGMVPQMVKNYVANFVFAFVLATMISYSGATSAFMGMVFAFWVWLGYVVTTTSIEVIWMKRSVKLWLFEAFASLVSILVMGAILGAW